MRWVLESGRRASAVLSLSQPLTAAQLSRRTDWTLDACCYVFWELTSSALTTCLNASAQRCRLYSLTELGLACRRRLLEQHGVAAEASPTPSIADWHHYGQVCFRHREAVVKALSEPMQPAAAKRRARQRDAKLRMSAGNAREVMQYLHQEGIVRPVVSAGEPWPRYELTELGQAYRTLLMGAENLEVRRPC